MPYRHGVYTSEVPTAILPPANVDASLPVVVGSAPINMGDPTCVNKAVLVSTYAEAVAAFGFLYDFDNWTLCEAIWSHFVLYNMGPMVLINIIDPSNAAHKTAVSAESVVMSGDSGTVANVGALLSTVVVKVSAAIKTLGTDYTLAFDSTGKLVISRVTAGSIASGATLTVDYTYLKPSGVVNTDIIGGIDGTTGALTGLELINAVYPLYGKVPGVFLAPKWSTDSTVAAIMKAKVTNINGIFKAMALVDVPTGTVKKYSDVNAWKNTNNYTAESEAVCWPKVKLGNYQMHLSTALAGIMADTDYGNGDVPYVSPSNHDLNAVGAVLADGTAVNLGLDSAAYMEGIGVVTAINFSGGWKAWGNRTGCYPSNTDPKDSFIPCRRMMNWIANTLILTFFSKVDAPLNRRLIDTVVDSANIWLNGLTAAGYIIGGHVDFNEAENPTTSLMDGIAKFHVYVTPATPAREIDFVLEYDPTALAALFS